MALTRTTRSFPASDRPQMAMPKHVLFPHYCRLTMPHAAASPPRHQTLLDWSIVSCLVDGVVDRLMGIAKG